MVGVEMNGDADPGDILHRMPRKMTGPGADTRSRKISHRKVIIHDDGEICNKTYNKVLAPTSSQRPAAPLPCSAAVSCMIEVDLN